MPSLRDTQLRFAASLAASAPTDDPRIAVYRSNGRANYRNALAASYPVVRRLTGVAFFNAAVDAFVAVDPPVSGDLNVYGDRFAHFLEGYAPAVPLGYLPDVARLEWAIDASNRAVDAPRLPDAVLAAFANATPERLPALRLALDASCRLLVSAYPILHIWRANQPDRSGDETIDLAEGGVALLVRRDARGVAIETLSPSEHAWLRALVAGLTLGSAIDAALAADAAFDLGATLRAHIAAGTIAAVIDHSAPSHCAAAKVSVR